LRRRLWGGQKKKNNIRDRNAEGGEIFCGEVQRTAPDKTWDGYHSERKGMVRVVGSQLEKKIGGGAGNAYGRGRGVEPKKLAKPCRKGPGEEDNLHEKGCFFPM